MPAPFVLFGTHPLFGDYVDAIHSVGGILTRLVRNIEEPASPPGQRVEDRIARYEDWLQRQGLDHRVQVEWLSTFQPNSHETAVAGFRGPKLESLVRELQQRFDLHFPPLIHQTACVSPMAILEEGVFVGAGTIVAPHTRVGRFTYLNRGVTLGHDGEIGDYVIIGPSASLASGVHLQRGAIIGIGATVVEDLRIGTGSYVAAGAVVLKDVADHRLVAGVPAVDKKAFLPESC
ncbi:MAG: hypothetical protein ABIT76_00895 [Chthoniobacterales bacterium]